VVPGPPGHPEPRQVPPGHSAQRAPQSGSHFIGKLLGQNYRIVEPIGAGAMGMVYVVEHVTLKKRFAAKILTADLARRPEAVARFEVEAHAASQLDHENVVSVIDFGRTEDGCVYLVMELLRGKSLQARMDQGRLSLEETVAITLQVCRALAAAHGSGIVHRDMKPDNIFLTQRPGGRPIVKVLDFGISKAREGTRRDGRITKQGQLLGSPEYMSPEASRGEEVDARADIYAVGILLYELLCGEVPFWNENYLKVLHMHVGTPPRPPRALRPDLPEPVEHLILRALEKDARRRHQTIEQFEAELIAAIPEVVQRALLMVQTPPRSKWLPEQDRLRFVTGNYPAQPPSLPDPAPTRPRSHTVTTTLDTRRRHDPETLLWSGAIALAVAAVALLVLLLARGAGDAESPAPAAAAPAAIPSAASPAAEPAPARRDEIRLRVDTTPPGATATLDGKPLGRTPIDMRIAASSGEGQIDLELPGYRSASRTIALDRDGRLRVSLDRERRRSNRDDPE
jgi:eukaryotic-like serine/threonine-protein kinase